MMDRGTKGERRQKMQFDMYRRCMLKATKQLTEKLQAYTKFWAESDFCVAPYRTIVESVMLPSPIQTYCIRMASNSATTLKRSWELFKNASKVSSW